MKHFYFANYFGDDWRLKVLKGNQLDQRIHAHPVDVDPEFRASVCKTSAPSIDFDHPLNTAKASYFWEVVKYKTRSIYYGKRFILHSNIQIWQSFKFRSKCI